MLRACVCVLISRVHGIGCVMYLSSAISVVCEKYVNEVREICKLVMLRVCCQLGKSESRFTARQ